MFGLTRLLKLTGDAAKNRRARLWLEQLEDRTVPTLLGQQLFPADYPWNQNIHDAPLVSNSAAIITNIGSTIGIHPDWGEADPANGNAALYGIPVNVVHGDSTAKVSVSIDAYADESDLVPIPIPANAVIEGDYQNGPNPNGPGYGSTQRGDSHLIVWDEDNNIAYELFAAARPTDPGSGGVWHAAQESVWDMSVNSFRTLGYTSADAAGLSILAGLARPDEGLPVAQGGQGEIDHALRFTLPSSKILPQYIYPASHVVNVSSGSNKLPFGARLRLADTDAVNAKIALLDPQAQIIAHAMQQYGLVLSDIGTAMYVTGASASVDANNANDLVWNMDDVLGLRSLKAGDFEVVDLTPQVTGLNTSSASPGATITITGQNFSGAAGNLSVWFGTTASPSVTYVDDAHITATVPFASGSVDITVRSGVLETDPNDPNRNATDPVFGYGTSAVTAASAFTFGPSQTISPSNSSVSFATSTVQSGSGDIITFVVNDINGDPVGGLANGNFQLVLSGGTSTGMLGNVTATGTLGTYTATFTGVKSGTAKTLTVTVASVTLDDTPTVTVTPGPVSASKSSVSLATATPAIGVADTLTLTVKDAAGNAITGLANSAFSFSLASGTTAGTFGTVSATATPGVYTTDFTGTTAGSTSTLTVTISSIALSGPPTITVTSTTSYTDDFGAAGANSGLTAAWTGQTGSFHVDTNTHTATGTGPINLAVISAISNADEAVTATVTVKGTQRAGIVARYAGTGDRNMYYAAVVAVSANKYRAIINRNVNGIWKSLYSKTYVGTVTNAALEFDVIGSSLRLFVNGGIIAFANDTKLTAAGSVGMRTSAGAIVSAFAAGPLTLSNQSLAFSDNFTTAGANGQLRNSWLNQVGNTATSGNAALGVGGKDLATVNGITAADVTVQADIVLSALGQSAGLVARYSGSGDQNMYLARVTQTGANAYTAALMVNVNGTWKTLKSKTIASGTGTLALAISGNSLTVSYGGSVLFTAVDSSITAAGEVGLRLKAGAAADNFSAT